MATKIRHKRSSVSGKVPSVVQLESGELAINTADGKVFLKRDDNTVQDLTQKIFKNDTEIRIDDNDDSSQGVISVVVDSSEKIRMVDTQIELKETTELTNANSLVFKELIASGNDGISIKAPDTLDAGYNLVLPPDLGLTGEVLRLGTSGQLLFEESDIFGGNTIYVSAEKGDDGNDGINRPVKTVKRACQIASGLVYNIDGTPNGKRINIKVAVGDYTEQNPIIVPDNVVIKGDGLRGCIIRPANANLDMLRVRNGCYFAEFTFRDKVDVNFVPLLTWNYAVAFDDPDDITVSRVGYTNLPETRPNITTSPYIQNCSIISFLGGNGAKIDGSKVSSPNTPIIQIEAENPVVGAAPEQGKSMVSNAFTMLSFGGTGWRLTNDAYAQIVSCFQIFMLNGVYCQSGGYCSITNSATNFGLYALRSSGYSPKAFQFDRGYVVNSGVSQAKQTLTVIGVNRAEPINEFVLRFREPEYKIAYDLIESNKSTIATDTINWINAQIAGATPGSIWDGFTYNSSQYETNLLILLDAVAQDTWGTGNQLTRQVALSYYTNRLADSSNTIVSGEIEQLVAAIEQASVFTATVIASLDSEVRAFVDSKFDLVKEALNDPESIPEAVDVTSQGDISNNYKNPPTETTFNAATDVNSTTNIFTINSHGFVNRQAVVYSANGNAPIAGLDEGQTYYIDLINTNEFRLTFDESGDFAIDVLAVGSGTHKFLSNIREFYVVDILESHTTYQRLILGSGTENHEFVPGRAITGVTGPSNNSAYVYSWKPNIRELIVSIELVTVGPSTQRVQFTASSTIDSDHSLTPFTNIDVDSVSSITNISTSTFTLEGTIDGSLLINLINLPEKAVWFHRPSIVNSSSHTWEYAGSGIDYNALPQNGGNTREAFEQFEELPGRVYSSGTNELGDFKVGDFITAFNRTGNITFRNKVTVDELDVLRLALSDIVIEEISTNVNLGDDELGGPSNTRLSTQLAIRSFLSNRLGGFIDKAVSTAAVPGAIVQLNTNGQLNAELIPATRTFTNTDNNGYLSRLSVVEEIPAVDLKGGDIATENYEQIELTFASGVTASDGDIITQATTGATGYVKGDYTNSTNILIASIGAEFKSGDDSTGTDFDTVNNISVNNVSIGQAPTVLGASSGIVENFFLKSSNSSQYLIISNGNNFVFTTAEISTVARNTNTATIVTTANHNLNPGNNIQIICSDTTYNANTIIISTPTNTSFTYANTGGNQGTTSETGSVRTIVTSADGNAQGAVTETRYGVLVNVDNANITGGTNYTPVSGSLVYENVPLNTITGTGSGATADITVTAGQVTDVNLRRGGTGYAIGDLVGAEANYLGEDSAGTGFEIEILAVENRVYVNILGGELFVATQSSVDYLEDNNAVNTTATITLTDTISKNFLAGDTGAGGDVNYTSSRITISSHGFTNGDPVTYDTLGNVAVGGLLNGSVYYVKVIDSSTIELYSNYNLLNKISFLSTPANNNHNLTRYQINVIDNSVIVPSHGLSTGDAIRITGNDLFSISGTQVDSGERFFIGSVTTNSFTLHFLRSEALASINGLVTNARNIDTVGTGTADVIEQNVQISNVVNTSSRLKINWNSLAATNIDASNIISGVIDPSRLAGSGVANTDTFLRGDSSYQTVVQSLKKANTTDNPITLTGSNLSGEFYGDPVNIGIANVDFDPAATYSTLGVARFFQAQFDVDVNATGQVFIKDGVVDAGTLDSLDSSYFLNPANLTSNVPVNRGGTNLSTYAIGDIIYAQSSGSLNTLAIGRNNSFLKSNGTIPEWGTALDLAEGLDVGSARLSSTSTGIGTVYNENVTSLELGSEAENVKIGRSTSGRNITTFCNSYDASISDIVTVNLKSLTQTTNGITANTDNEVPMTSTVGILYGMLVTGSASIPANTTVTGVTTNYIYLSNNTTGTISTSTTLTFTYTPTTLGIRTGDTVTIAGSGITNLNGEWPVIGATFNATSFTIQTDANVTANPANPIGGTITKANTIIFRNRNAIFGSAEASISPVDATLKGESGIGNNIAGGQFIIQAGLGTGNATGGNFVVRTGQVGSSGDIEQTATTRLTIDTSGTSTFSGIITANSTIQANSANGITTNQTTFPLINTTATTVNFAGASTALTIGATTGTATIRNASVVLSGDLEVRGGDIITNQTTFNLVNATATTVNFAGAGTTISIGAGTGNTTVNNNLVVSGDLTVNGTTTTVNSTTISVDDKNIELGSVNSPTDVTADGGGITLRGTTDKTIIWDDTNDNWTSSEHWNIATGKSFKINNVSVLNSTTLGSTVVNSSLTTVGTIGTGVWQGSIINPTYGGTGVNNGTKTITLGGNFTHTGAHTLTLTTTGNTNVTLPTTGTLATTGNLSQFAATTSAQLRGVISDETGSGVLVFGTSPTFTTGINAASTTMALFNTTATTINFGQAATTLTMGATTGTTRVRNNLDVDGDINIDGGDLTFSDATINIAAATATTVNFAKAGTLVDIGATSGTTSINNNLDVDLDLNVDGGDITTNAATFNLLNTNATTVNAFGAATTINMGASGATTTITGDVSITGTASFGGIDVSAIDDIPIGSVTPSTGAFTTLTASGLTTFTNTTAATSTTTGAVVITGGLGVGGAVHANSFTGSIAASNVDSGTFDNARIAESNVTQHQAAITGTGALNSGSITSGFGNINIGADNLTATGTVSLGATNFNGQNVTGILDLTIDDQIISTGDTNTYLQFHAADQWRVVTGGAERLEVNNTQVTIANNLVVSGTNGISGVGTLLTALNADNLGSGTVPSARITGTYSNLTGTGALDAGQITSNFGDINIGTSTFTGNGSGLTNVDADTVDGIQGASFLRSDANDIAQGFIEFQGTGNRIRISTTSATGNTGLEIWQPGFKRAEIEFVNGGIFKLKNGQASKEIHITSANPIWHDAATTTDYTIWHSGNDGSGSTLDADTVDGIEAASFVQTSGNQTIAGDKTFSGTVSIAGNITHQGDTNTSIGFPANDTIALTTNNVARMTFTPTGDIILGNGLTASVPANAVVRGTSGSGTNINGGSLFIDGGLGTGTGQGGALYFRTSPAVASGTTLQTPETRMYINRAGNVGVNTTQPLSTFTVAGTTTTNDLNMGGFDEFDPTINFRVNVNQRASIGYTNTNSRLTISNAYGNVYIDGGTSGTSSNGLKVFSGGKVAIGGGGTPSGTISLEVTGDFASTGEVTAYSDITLKDNIEVIVDPLTKILSIRGVTFTRNDHEDKETRHMGVIAQEVEQYFPEVVSTMDNGIKTVNYGAMAGAFIEAFKEQQKQIDELKALVEKLLDK